MTGDSSFDPKVMALRGRIGAHVTHAGHDPHEITAKARAAFRESFEALVDPDGSLPPEERARRAEHLRKAHLARLALRSAEVRRNKAAAKKSR
jgi:4'-phosphopantetheinyl transferase EntD